MARASLPWYDLPEIRSATDALWDGIRRHLAGHGIDEAPHELDRRQPHEEVWAAPDLLFSQACGYDVLIAYPDTLRLVATPHYRADGCAGDHYASFVVVRDGAGYDAIEDLRGTRCVINSPTSHSGMNILRSIVAPLHEDGRFFSQVKFSGSHASSLYYITSGAADVATIDCVTHALIAAHRPEALDGTHVIGRTERVLAPPFVTHASADDDRVERIRGALDDALSDPSLASARDTLLLADLDVLALDAYGRIRELEDLAEQAGYAEIPHRLPDDDPR